MKERRLPAFHAKTVPQAERSEAENNQVIPPVPPPLYPWTAQIATESGEVREIPRPTLIQSEVGAVFPLSGLAPIESYTILDPANPQRSISLDTTQLGAVNLVLSGASCNIIGAAGTGKSTILQATLELLQPHLPPQISYRLVRSNGERESAPPAALIAYTNKAKNVIASKIQASPILRQAGFGANITTAHNLLEYTRINLWSEEKQKEVMRFIEQRDARNPLSISHLFIDESSMLGVGKAEAEQLGNKLLDASRAGVQLTLIGDINQIPPVGGKSILSYGLSQLPIAELTTIHRQALDSPIISQAWEILQGREPKEQMNTVTGSTFRIIDPKSRTKGAKIGAETMNLRLEHNLPKFIDKGYFVPGEDIILCPFNKAESTKNGPPKVYVSTTHLNNVVASYLAKKEDRLVYHIIAGYNNIFLSIGDRVLVDKVEGTVVGINKSASYYGKRPKPASTHLNYWGHMTASSHELEHLTTEEQEEEDLDYDFSQLSIDDLTPQDGEEGELTRSASHVVEVQLDGETSTTVLSASGQFHPQIFTLGYAISIHKAQGSEWRNVFVVVHDCHAIALSRELLYTAVTRPRENLYLIGQQHTIAKAVKRARIRGNNLAEKLAFFNEGEYLNAGEDFSFSKLSLLPIEE